MLLDTIDVELQNGVVKADPEKYIYEDYHYTDIVLILNGDVVKGTFDPFEFAVPRVRQANWFLLSCSCGIAGCGRYHYGVNIKRRAHTVEWRDQEQSDGYSKGQTFHKRFFAFNRHEYEAVQEKCLGIMHSIAHEREQTIAEEDRPEGHDVDNFIPWYTVESFNKSIDRYRQFIAEKNRSWSW
jgi:hypothetical protein